MFIHWTDAIFEDGWHEDDEYKSDETEMEHYTVGKFVRQDKNSISLCQSWRVHGKTDYGIGEIMTIPKKMIKKVEMLKKL